MALFALGTIRPDNAAAFVAPDAVVIGRVSLRSEASVWYGAVLRGDNEPIIVEPRTNIQEHTVIHTDPGYPVTIGEGCTIGHRAIIHGCTIGRNTLIGMGAIVLNGAVIGDNCLIGAGALIPEGKTIPDGSLVIGTPGKVVRALDEAAIDGLRRSAERYVANAHRHASEVLPL